MKIGILTDFPSVAVQSGPAIHTRFLHDGMRSRGHEVTLLGPETGVDTPIEGTNFHLFKGVSYPSHPKVKIVLPWPAERVINSPELDVLHGQVNSHFMHYGVWLRERYKTALLNTHTIHLPTHSHFLVSDSLYAKPFVREQLLKSAHNLELSYAKTYNSGDALIVQSRYFVDYWRERGVTVPIEVVGRPINPSLFDGTPEADPFPAHFVEGKRLLVVCRHDREKSLDKLIDWFADHIAVADPEVTLTLVGDGFDHMNLVERASNTNCADRIYFPGEIAHGKLRDWYAYAQVFVYTSVSETFGNVINEALWCGLPVVALNDNMGVAHQVVDGYNGYLIEPNDSDAAEQFSEKVMALIDNPELFMTMSAAAAQHSRENSHPDVVLSRFEAIYERARKRVHDTVPVPLSERSRREQAAAFARHMGAWSFWHSTLLGVAYATIKLGAGRPVELGEADTRVLLNGSERARPRVLRPLDMLMSAIKG